MLFFFLGGGGAYLLDVGVSNQPGLIAVKPLALLCNAALTAPACVPMLSFFLSVMPS